MHCQREGAAAWEVSADVMLASPSWDASLISNKKESDKLGPIFCSKIKCNEKKNWECDHFACWYLRDNTGHCSALGFAFYPVLRLHGGCFSTGPGCGWCVDGWHRLSDALSFPVNFHQLFYLYPAMIFCCNDKILITALGWKGLPWLAAVHLCIKVGAGTQSRNLEAGTEAEAMEECCLLAYFIWLAQPVSLLGPPTSIIS